MSKSPKKDDSTKMIVTVQGREITMYFAAEPNAQVALQVKQALLGAYLPVAK